MTISWKISQLDRQTSNGFVTTAHWQCVGVDGDVSDSVYSTCSWTGEPTVAYADLTEAQVLAWVWASGVDKAATEAALADKIAAEKNPTAATGLPW